MAYWKTATGAVLLTLSMAGVALAQGTPASPAAKTSAPQPIVGDPTQTTATYGDWLMRCVHAGNGGTGPQTCEIVQTLVRQGQTQPVAEIAIGSIAKSAGLLFTVAVPTIISLGKEARVVGATGTPSLFDLTWRRCLPGGCFADTPLNAEAVKMLRARTDPANLIFQDASDQDVTLPFSMRGFPQALDALLKEISIGK